MFLDKKVVSVAVELTVKFSTEVVVSIFARNFTRTNVLNAFHLGGGGGYTGGNGGDSGGGGGSFSRVSVLTFAQGDYDAGKIIVKHIDSQ